jgi:hypothetical protein
MYSLNQIRTLVSCGRDSARSLPLRRGFLLIPLILLCFAVVPQMHALTPAPDGGYGNFTTAEGDNALGSLSTITGGAGNTAVGWFSLFSNTTGAFNTALGAGALVDNNGDSNTALGTVALLLNTTGFNNTAAGSDAMVFNDSGIFNNAFGAFALENNFDGFSNNAVGEHALALNITAAANTAVGDVALGNNDSDGLGMGNNNVGVGAGALAENVDGSENTAVGTGAGQSNLVTGFNNTYLGDFVGSTAADESSTIRIGDLSNGNGAGSLECYIGGIFNNNQPVGGTVVEVTIDLANDHLGWDAGPSGKVPVLKRGAPARRGLQQPGARPQLQHQAMLNDKVEKLQTTVAQQQNQIAQQQKQIETLTVKLGEQAEQIQKVSAQLEMVRSTPRVVNNQ